MIGYPHAERHEEGYGGNDHRGETAADELYSAGLAEVVDEGLAEGEEEKPLEVAILDGLEVAGEGQRGQHDECGYCQTQGDEDGDGHVLFGEEEFLG